MKNVMYIFQIDFASYIILDHDLDLKQCYLSYSTNYALTLSVLILCIEPLIPQLEPYKWIRASRCVSKYWHDCNFLSWHLGAQWIPVATVKERHYYLQKWLCNDWFRELDFPEENEKIFFSQILQVYGERKALSAWHETGTPSFFGKKISLFENGKADSSFRHEPFTCI